MKPLHRFFFFLPLLIQAHKSSAQDSLSGVSVTVSPALFTPVSVAVQAGVQVRLNRRSSFLAEVAYPTFYPTSDYEKTRYWRGSITWKFYSSKPKREGQYYAAQAAYLYRQLTDNNSGIVHLKNGEYSYDNAVIHSPVLSVAAIIGHEFSSKNKRFFADVFGGLGLRHLFNKYTVKELRLTSLTRQKDSFDWLIPDEGWRFGYALTRLHLTGGLRFGVRL